jgi:uncharacterized membrane protein YbhN (UPF0104 family)
MKSNKYYFPILLAAGVFGFAFYYREEVMDALTGIQIPWVIAGFICILFNYCLRALRLNVLTDRMLKIWPQGLYCISVHGFVTYMLPLRSGDLSLPFLLKSIANVDLKEGAIILYKARLLELFTLGIWLVAAALVSFPKLHPVIIGTMILSGTLMALAPFLIQQLSDRSLLPFGKFNQIINIIAKASKMNLREIALTCGIWLLIALSIWCIALAMQLYISTEDIILLIALQLVMQLIPVQGFANSGNHESGWVAALVLTGRPMDIALKFALTSHAILLLYVLLLGLIALILKYAFIR